MGREDEYPVKTSLRDTVDAIRSLALFVQEESPRLIFRLEAAEKIDTKDPGFFHLLEKIHQALNLDETPTESEVVDLWALDLWEYNQKEYEYFSEHPEKFTGFTECGIARVLSHVALTLDFGEHTYLFVMYNMADHTIDLKTDVPREDYEAFLEALPF